jgi:hypothetical protein
MILLLFLAPRRNALRVSANAISGPAPAKGLAGGRLFNRQQIDVPDCCVINRDGAVFTTFRIWFIENIRFQRRDATAMLCFKA